MAVPAGSREPDVVRAGMPLLAAGIVVVAAFSDPSGWWQVALLVPAAAVMALWARWPRLHPLALTVGVLVPVVIAQLPGALEPAMFLISLLAVAVAGWGDSIALAVGAGVAAAASPVLIAALQPPDNRLSASIWVGGVAVPWAIGLLVRRQERLTEQLRSARLELAERAVADERRRIARDVHDLVGHGLAAMLLQVTSARHVLRRDPDGADEALASAEQAGRRSMSELRWTVALLRSDDERAGAALPAPERIGDLVDAARAGGLDVRYRTSGDLARLGPAVGVALYRIAQESLSNAARHAPHARTEVHSRVEDAAAALDVETVGPLVGSTEQPGFGVVGMRERAEAVGGSLHAGTTPDGWSVRCRIPLEPAAAR